MAEAQNPESETLISWGRCHSGEVAVDPIVLGRLSGGNKEQDSQCESLLGFGKRGDKTLRWTSGCLMPYGLKQRVTETVAAFDLCFSVVAPRG